MARTSATQSTRAGRPWLTSHRLALGLAGLTAIAYWLSQDRLLEWTSEHPDLNFYVAQPIMWSGVAAVAVLGWRHLDDRPNVRPTLIALAALTGGLQVALLIYGGYLNGFGDSPVAGRLVNYPKNLLYVTTLVAGIEAARAYIVTTTPTGRRTWVLTGVTIAGAIAYTPLAQIRLLLSGDLPFEVITGRLIPVIALSTLLTWLAHHGGLGPSFGYALPVLGWEFFAPSYPSNPWWFMLAVGTIVPIFAPRIIDRMYSATDERKALGALATFGSLEADEDEADDGEMNRTMRVVWTSIAGGLLLAFFVAFVVLGIRPHVVTGISMEPAYERGDLALVRGVEAGSLAIGDVIVFSVGSTATIHRIIEIDHAGDGVRITTQGDNVARPDPPISGDDVEGKVVFLLPEIGHLALWLRGG